MGYRKRKKKRDGSQEEEEREMGHRKRHRSWREGHHWMRKREREGWVTEGGRGKSQEEEERERWVTVRGRLGGERECLDICDQSELLH